MSLLIARMFIFCLQAVVYCSIPALVCVLARLCRAQLLLCINPRLLMETQHQGHTLSKQVAFIKPRAGCLHGAVSVWEADLFRSDASFRTIACFRLTQNSRLQPSGDHHVYWTTLIHVDPVIHRYAVFPPKMCSVFVSDRSCWEQTKFMTQLVLIKTRHREREGVRNKGTVCVFVFEGCFFVYLHKHGYNYF